MKKYPILLICLFSLSLTCVRKGALESDGNEVPELLLGTFEDDYGIQYTITQSQFNFDGLKHAILEVDKDASYLLVKNDSINNSFPGKFSRIDCQNRIIASSLGS